MITLKTKSNQSETFFTWRSPVWDWCLTIVWGNYFEASKQLPSVGLEPVTVRSLVWLSYLYTIYACVFWQNKPLCYGVILLITLYEYLIDYLNFSEGFLPSLTGQKINKQPTDSWCYSARKSLLFAPWMSLMRLNHGDGGSTELILMFAHLFERSLNVCVNDFQHIPIRQSDSILS